MENATGSKRIKICFFGAVLYGTGGLEVMLAQLANHLAGNNMEVYIISSNEPAETKIELSPNIKVKTVREDYNYANCKKIDYYIMRIVRVMSRVLKIKETDNLLGQKINEYVDFSSVKCKRIIEEINKINPDITIGVNRGAILLGKIADKIPGKKIGWQHTCYDAYMNKNEGHVWLNINKISPTYLKKLDRHVVLTDYDKEDFLKNDGILTTTIHNFSDNSIKEKSNVESHKMIAVGRLATIKQYDLLLDAWHIFKRKSNDWILEIYGEGPEENYLRNKIKELDIADSARLCGFTKDVNEKVASASAMVVTSKHEGFPLGVLEAMMIGVPIIGFDISALRYLITNGEEGYLSAKNDVEVLAANIKKVSEDLNLRKKMSSACMKKASQFDKEKVLGLWDALIEEITKE